MKPINSHVSFIPYDAGHKDRLTPKDIQDARFARPGIQSYGSIVGKILAKFNFVVKHECTTDDGKKKIHYLNINSLNAWKKRQAQKHGLNASLFDFSKSGAFDDFINAIKEDKQPPSKPQPSQSSSPITIEVKDKPNDSPHAKTTAPEPQVVTTQPATTTPPAKKKRRKGANRHDRNAAKPQSKAGAPATAATTSAATTVNQPPSLELIREEKIIKINEDVPITTLIPLPADQTIFIMTPGVKDRN